MKWYYVLAIVAVSAYLGYYYRKSREVVVAVK